jgi:hypothetical protein
MPAFEKLHFPLVLLGFCQRIEGAQVFVLAGPGINGSGIQPVSARFKFADHGSPLCMISNYFKQQTDYPLTWCN